MVPKVIGDSLFGLMAAKVKHLQVVLNQVTGKSTFFRISAVLLPLNNLVQKPWVFCNCFKTLGHSQLTYVRFPLNVSNSVWSRELLMMVTLQRTMTIVKAVTLCMTKDYSMESP